MDIGLERGVGPFPSSFYPPFNPHLSVTWKVERKRRSPKILNRRVMSPKNRFLRSSLFPEKCFRLSFLNSQVRGTIYAHICLFTEEPINGVFFMLLSYFATLK